MRYSIEISPRASKDLRKLDAPAADRILLKIADMANDLDGDIKHLTNFEPEYRLRVGDFRVLFDLEGTKIVVRRIKNRREAY
jgi:mRNA interferase RelE/StbE